MRKWLDQTLRILWCDTQPPNRHLHVAFRGPRLFGAFLATHRVFSYCVSKVHWTEVYLPAYWFITDPETVPCNQKLAFFTQRRGQPYPRTLYVCWSSRGHPCRLEEHSCSGASKALPLFLLSQLERDSICCERRTMACSLCLSLCVWIKFVWVYL